VSPEQARKRHFLAAVASRGFGPISAEKRIMSENDARQPSDERESEYGAYTEEQLVVVCACPGFLFGQLASSTSGNAVLKLNG
jgi:hypothetical protein